MGELTVTTAARLMKQKPRHFVLEESEKIHRLFRRDDAFDH